MFLVSDFIIAFQTIFTHGKGEQMKEEIQKQVIEQIKTMSDPEVFYMLQNKLFETRQRIAPIRFFLRHFKSEGAYDSDNEDLQGLSELISDHITILDEIAFVAEMAPKNKHFH